MLKSLKMQLIILLIGYLNTGSAGFKRYFGNCIELKPEPLTAA